MNKYKLLKPNKSVKLYIFEKKIWMNIIREK